MLEASALILVAVGFTIIGYVCGWTDAWHKAGADFD